MTRTAALALALTAATARAGQVPPEPTVAHPGVLIPSRPLPDEPPRAASGMADLTGIPVPEMAGCDTVVEDFMATFAVPGLTFALAKDGKLAYLRAFGVADVAGVEPTQPYHMFRIASISKPITAVAIMQLVEEGALSLDDTVFGSGALLEGHPAYAGATITDARVYDITVQHLLEHTAGWNRDVDCFPDPTSPYPWFFRGCDPIAAPLHVTEVLGDPNPASEDSFVRFLLEKDLNFAPGTDWAYSNIGFTILGEIIEEVTSRDYEEHVKSQVLAPIGICDMHLAGNLLADKREREGEYVGLEGTTKSCYGTGDDVLWEYGGLSLEGMDSHGAWIASARALTQLLVAVDGLATKPDILMPGTIADMTTPSTVFANYAKGWLVNDLDNWWHTGALPGTASFFGRTSDGYTWAIIMNRRGSFAQWNEFWTALDLLPGDCLRATTGLPTHDLMAVPLRNAANVALANHTGDAVTVSWDPGDGDQRIVVGRQGSAVTAFPLDGTAYTASAAFGVGDDLDGGNFVVYAGTGSSVEVTGLTPDVEYAFRVFELNQSAVTGNYPLYLLCNSETASTTCAQPTVTPNTLWAVEATPPGGVTLSWSAAGSGSFNLHRTVDPTTLPTLWSNMSTSVGTTVTTTIDDMPPAAPIQHYRLHAADCLGNSVP